MNLLIKLVCLMKITMEDNTFFVRMFGDMSGEFYMGGYVGMGERWGVNHLIQLFRYANY